MDLTEIKVFPVNEEKLKAYVTIVLDGCFVVRDLKIIYGSTGLFVAMPSKKRKDGTYKDIAHPLNQSTRRKMEEQILKMYLDTIKPDGTDKLSTGSRGSHDDLDGQKDPSTNDDNQ